MAQITLTQGLFAIIDDCDVERASAFKWHASRRHSKSEKFVAVSGRGGTRPNKTGRVYLHRLILNAPAEAEVDHINQNPLDNRRCNLRLATRQQNCANIRFANKTGFRGVSRHGKRFRAYISLDCKSTPLGSFTTAEEAARAYDLAAIARDGEFAILNFAPGDR